MNKRPDLTPAAIHRVLPRPGPGAAYRIAFSGGLDSSVLLDLLANLPPSRPPVQVIHVDHGLQAQSGAWAGHCAEVCAQYGVPCSVRRVTVAAHAAQGLEAAARRARYAALKSLMKAGDVLLTAHHQDDQAETVLLRLMRGAGPRGLAGIPTCMSFGPGMLARPLLGWRCADLLRYAREHDLRWLEDPSNRDEKHERNYLRRRVLPALEARWPAASDLLARSAKHAGEGAELLQDLAAMDLAACAGEEDNTLNLSAFAGLKAARRRNLLIYWLRRLDLPPPPGRRLEEAADVLARAAADTTPLVAWAGAELRRYRERIYAMPPLPAPPGGWYADWDMQTPLELPAGCGRLLAAPIASGEIGLALEGIGAVRVAFRQSGERLRPAGHIYRKTLKQLWQEAGVPPWARERTPLLYYGEELVAVGERWIAQSWASQPCKVCVKVVWESTLARLNLS
jgi:tRNA(Ile)-lysidine synthase